jgi:lysozyme
MTDLTIARELCKEFEGFRARPYICPAGVPTIGYGTTRYMDGRPVAITDPPVSKEEAEALLDDQLRSQYLVGVLRLCPTLLAHPTKLNAIVDFAYNLGVGRLQTSTLRRRINQGDWGGAKEQLMRWVRGGGKVLPGLVRRRAAEAALLDRA